MKVDEALEVLDEKIAELELEYNAIDLSEPELELNRRNQLYDEQLNYVNSLRTAKEAKLAELKQYRHARNVLTNLT